MKKRAPKQESLKLVDTSCWAAGALMGVRHPCNAVYANKRTRTVVHIQTTTEAHGQLPKRVKSLSALRRRRGVIVSQVLSRK